MKAVLPLDAFARCWVQEGSLLHAIEAALAGERRALMAACVSLGKPSASRPSTRRWRRSRPAWRGSPARSKWCPIAGSLRSKLRSVGAALGVGASEESPAAAAQKKLAERMAEEVRANTLELIRLHGLDGQVQGEILSRLATHFETRLRLDEGKAAMWGGLVTGALAGPEGRRAQWRPHAGRRPASPAACSVRSARPAWRAA